MRSLITWLSWTRLATFEVDKMPEKAIETTRHKQFTAVQYARFADDQVILVDPIREGWLEKAIRQRLRED